MPYIKPYKAKIVGVVFFSACLAGISGLQVSLVKPIFDHGLSPDANLQEVMLISGKILLLGLLNYPCRFLHFYWMRFVWNHAVCSLRLDIFNKFLKLPTSFFNTNKRGQLISNIINDSEIFSMGFKAIVDLIREPLKILVYLVVAFWIDWQLTLSVFATIPILIIIFEGSSRKIRRHQGMVQKEYGELTHNVSESLEAHKLTKAFNLQKYIFDRFRFNQDSFFSAQMKTSFVEELTHPFMDLMGAAIFATIIILAHYRIQSGAMTVGDFAAFFTATALFIHPIRQLGHANVSLSQAKAASDRLQELFVLPEELNEGTVEISQFTREIEVKDLSFNYGEGEVLKNLNLKIKKGEKVALVGLLVQGNPLL